jgi:hypothetical protein
LSPRLPILLALSPLLLGGCAATTLRLDAGPTIDSSGGPGFESTLSLGFGVPTNVGRDRSHHFIQGMGSLGGGMDTRDGSGIFVAATTLNYIYWAEPTLDVRAGLRYAYRAPVPSSGRPALNGFGGHLAILPLLQGGEPGVIVPQLCLGPELRIEALWGEPPDDDRALFSLPLVAELTLLMTGD